MTAEVLREFDAGQLEARLTETEEQLFRVRFNVNAGHPEGVSKLHELKIIRARIKTIKRERELAGSSLKSTSASVQVPVFERRLNRRSRRQARALAIRKALRRAKASRTEMAAPQPMRKRTAQAKGESFASQVARQEEPGIVREGYISAKLDLWLEDTKPPLTVGHAYRLGLEIVPSDERPAGSEIVPERFRFRVVTNDFDLSQTTILSDLIGNHSSPVQLTISPRHDGDCHVAISVWTEPEREILYEVGLDIPALSEASTLR